jgi:hypothetical protein
MYALLIYVIVVIPFILWLAFFFIHPRVGVTYEMDNGLGSGSFYGTFVLYRHLAYTIFAVAIIGASFSAYKGWPPATIVLGGAAIYALLFNAWLMASYESYLAFKYPRNLALTLHDQTQRPSNYSGWKYALTIALGFSTLGFFVCGLILFLATLMER